MSNLAKTIKDAREALSMSQQQICDQIGAGATYVSRIERGESLGGKHLPQLCDILNLDHATVAKSFEKKNKTKAKSAKTYEMRDKELPIAASKTTKGVKTTALPMSTASFSAAEKELAAQVTQLVKKHVADEMIRYAQRLS